MKKLLFIILLCFIVAFATFAIDMSPQPGDTLETVFTVMDNVVISQVAEAPTDILYFDSIYNYDSFETLICLSANEKTTGIYNYLESGLNADMAVVYIDFEMGTIFNITGGVVSIYKTEFG